MVEEALDLEVPNAGQRLRLLSYNIQSGMQTTQHREYVTKSWKHFLPHREKQENLFMIAKILREYDIVALQEVDAGSLRSAFLDQTAYLAHHGGFPFWQKQVNRNVGHLAQFSNGFLSRFRPLAVHTHRLPGLRGRGAMVIEYGSGEATLSVVLLHLALGKRGRLRQMQFIVELIKDLRHVVVMGDLNCSDRSVHMQDFLDFAGLKDATCGAPTYPSWQPVRKIDHILVSNNLEVSNPSVVDFPLSDHLPISVDVQLPFELN